MLKHWILVIEAANLRVLTLMLMVQMPLFSRDLINWLTLVL